MPRSYKPLDLPNLIHLTAPENLEFMERMEAEEEAKKKTKAPTKAATKPRKRKADENVDPSPPSEDTSGPSRRAKKAKAPVSSPEKSVDLFAIHLPGEEEGEIEIYDSCDELRRKITVHLSVTGSTKAAFLREIVRAASSESYSIKTIQSKQLSDFLAHSGATGGNTSKVCYASYVYFEKKRIAEEKPKSKHRLRMEDEWAHEGGLTRERRWQESYIVPRGMKVVENQYGQIRSGW